MNSGILERVNQRMFKNQLQELAQRIRSNRPTYTCIKEGPDYALEYKSIVNFNGEFFESPRFYSKKIQAEHAAAEVALKTLGNRSPYKAHVALILARAGIYKNLLQQAFRAAGLIPPVYTTAKFGHGNGTVFRSKVEFGGLSFPGLPAKLKKQAEKNAAMAAWFALKFRSGFSSSSPLLDTHHNYELQYVTVARLLARLCSQETNSRSSSQNDQQRRSAPVRTMAKPSNVRVPMHPILNPGRWGSNPVFPNWHHEQAFQQLRGSILPLLFAPLPTTAPPVPAFITPVTVQEPFFVVPGTISEPPICVLIHPMPVQISTSQETIIKIREEQFYSNLPLPIQFSRSVETIEIFRDANIQFLPFETQNPPISVGSSAEPLIPMLPQHLGVSELRNSLMFMDSFRNSTPVDSARSDLLLKFSELVECSQLTLSQYPMMVRTVPPALPTFTDGTRVENLNPQFPPPAAVTTPSGSARTCSVNIGGTPSSINREAPEVQIRPMVPVCASPPEMKLPADSQEGLLFGFEKIAEEIKELALNDFQHGTASNLSSGWGLSCGNQEELYLGVAKNTKETT